MQFDRLHLVLPRINWVLTWICVSVLLFACQYQPEKWQKEKYLVATTGMVADALKNILPTKGFHIHQLMGAGIDPHTYEARPSDIRALGEAECIVYSGLHLEGKLTKIFHKIEAEKSVWALSDGLSKKELISVNEDLHDPHIWLDPWLWSKGVNYLGKKLALRYPEQAEEIAMNTEKYVKQILRVAEKMKVSFEAFPAEQRLLITSHDAFHYFGRAFGIEVMALQGVSTVSEPGILTVSKLSETIVKRKIGAVFIENSVSPKSILALIESCARGGHSIEKGGTLYSDALGGKKSGADTYLKMLAKNTETICHGWKKK